MAAADGYINTYIDDCEGRYSANYKSFIFQHVLHFLTFSYEDAMYIYKKLLEDDPANSVSFI